MEIVIEHYEKCFKKHGAIPKGVDWPNDKDLERRYKIMLELINENNATLLDFGCGYCGLYNYIQKNNKKISYSGIELSKSLFEYSSNKYKHLDIKNIDITKEEIKEYDYIIANGVFTMKINLTEEQMFECFKKIIIILYTKCKRGIAFNIMTPISDWFDDKLFYLSFDKLSLFIKKELNNKKFIIRQDYDLWEYTTYIYKEY